MPACAYSSVSPSDSKKSFDYFQRRKVGSIRDNPKLLKIRQQFESASQDESKKNYCSESAPTSLSFSLSKNSGAVVLDELLKLNTKLSDATEVHLKSQLHTAHIRRHSEGELKNQISLKLFALDGGLDEALKLPTQGRETSICKSSAGKKCAGLSVDNTTVPSPESSVHFPTKIDRQNRRSSLTSTENNSLTACSRFQDQVSKHKRTKSSDILLFEDSSKSYSQSFPNERKLEYSSRSSDDLLCSNKIVSNKSKDSTVKRKETFLLSKSLQTINTPDSSPRNSSESGIHTNSSASEEDTCSFGLRALHALEKSNKLGNCDISAPPIPKRGLSPAIQNNYMHSFSNVTFKNNAFAKDFTSSPSVIKSSTVQKAIEMYEGMSSNDVKLSRNSKSTNAYEKLTLRKDGRDSFGKKCGIYRRSSRRNSLRKSKLPESKASPSKGQSLLSPKIPESCSNKEDSGVGMSDGEDRNQSIYQTLSSKINLATEEKETIDTYDRLSRIHDMVNLIHKGLSSACAACKAIPSSALELRAKAESSMLQVKCNERGPHHHPPCICFACQHSIFSCSIDTGISADMEGEDGLYYNMCCLNSPNREGWRQSRRRPVCEQNGRLCIVNCDMEQRIDSLKMNNDFYEKLCEWHSTPTALPRRNYRSKQRSGESYDSDESWIDLTDSEDEGHIQNSTRGQGFWGYGIEQQAVSKEINKQYIIPYKQPQCTKYLRNTLSRRSDGSLSAQNTIYDLDQTIVKCQSLDLSRCQSMEHLYESIADIESKEVESNSKDTSLHSNGSSTLSLKSEQNADNDVDSGEWSTESASPTFDESNNKEEQDKKHDSVSNQHRFSVHLECQETAKKTFMKSVLGKKSSNPKNRRMSKFFVPWLVSNQEYNPSAPRSTKGNKSVPCRSNSPKSAACKNKRSQSMPHDSPKLSMSCTRALFCSTEILDREKSKESETENLNRTSLERKCSLSPVDPTLSSSSRDSSVSSIYLRSDQLQTSNVHKTKTSISSDTPVDVIVERVHRRPSVGDSDHSYILFQPIKEEEVPLYQFYERNIKERVSFCRSPNSLSPIMWSSLSESGCSHDNSVKLIKPQFSVVEQLSPDAKDMKMLWCELPEVKESGILERISAQELKLQEATFEFIQSQASYIRSLKVLFENFIKTPEFSGIESSTCVLSKHEHDVLFSDIIRVKEVSESLMCDLTRRWSDDILIPDICDIIFHHATMPSFSVYVKYCSNRVYQERTLKELKETRLCFLEVLRKLESNPACQGLSLESFLFLPMQHIARLPLLLDNIFRWLVPDSPSYGTCKMALEAVHKVFMECNEGARKMERLEEMFVLNKQLEFKECKAIPLISASRWLLKKGEIMKLEFDKKTFGRSSRCVRVPVYMFLFNDLLVVTKRKSEDSYTVIDYCSREKVQAMAVNAKDLPHPIVVPNTCRYLIYLTLFNNHQGSAVDMILNCALLSERTRWIEAIHSVPENKPCEVWEYDCPQVQCVRTYIAQQPDELSLQESDVVTIHRKMNDGWYEGRRLRDGLQGWFPASYTMDIPCSRARASNLRQCYRLLMLSQSQ